MKKRIFIACAFVLFCASLYADDATDRVFEHALGAFKSKNYGSAELMFKKLIDSSNDDYKDKARFYYARCIYYQKRYKSALYEFNSFVNVSRSASLSTQARFWMGESYYHLKEYVKAIEEYNRFITVIKDDKLIPIAHDRIASIYYSQKRYDESILEWNASIASSKDRDKNAYRVYRIGDAYFRDKKYDESLQRLNPILTSRAEQKIVAKAQILIGRIYQKNNNQQKALDIFQSIPEALLKNKGISDAYYFQALSYIKLKETRKALSLLDIYLMIGKGSSWYYNAKYEMAKLLVTTDGSDKGTELLEEVRKSATKEYIKIGASKILSDLYIAKEPSKAIPYLEESLSTENVERQKEIMIQLAKAYLKMKDYGKAGTMLKQYTDKFPFDSKADEIIFIQARIFLEKGDSTRALQHFEKIEKEYPFSKYLNESKYYLAIMQSRRGKTKETVSLLNQYIATANIKHPYKANLLLFDEYISSNELKNAEQVLQRIITKYNDKKDADRAIYSYAVAISNKGMNPWRYYTIIMTKYPKSETAMRMYLKIGNDFYKEKKYKEAITFYDKYLTSNEKKDRGTAYFNRLQSLYHLGQYKDLIATLEKGNLPPMDENEWQQIPLLSSRAHFNLKNYDEVYNNLYTDNLKKYDSNDLFMYAKSSIFVGDINTAIEILNYLKQDQEKYTESLYMIANYYNKKDESDLASSYYATVITLRGSGSIADKSRMELSRIFIDNNKFNDAIELLSKISSNELTNDKYALIALSHFKAGEAEKGSLLTSTKFLNIRGSEFGQDVFKQNVEYYYATRNMAKLLLYADYLKQYKDNNDYIAYMTGRIYYETKSFQNAFNNFYRLSVSHTIYSDEANYYLGKISLFIYKNNNNALKYFQKAAASDKNESIFKWKSKINIAIILNEINDRTNARKNIQDVLSGLNRGTQFTQAENLYEYFGLK